LTGFNVYYSDFWLLLNFLFYTVFIGVILLFDACVNKKLIRRWVSERELSLRRHRICTTKYNRLVHKFCHRSTHLC